MDVLTIFFVIGFVGGASGVGIAWIVWWEREKGKSVCPVCWPEEDPQGGQ